MRRDSGIFINWEEVHAIRHGLHDNPHHILGPHMEPDGVVINAYVKDALSVEVVHRDSSVRYEMRASGIEDFFTLATEEKEIFPYQLKATYRDGSTYEYIDPYCFDPVIDNMDIASFSQGIHYDIYQLLGAHKKTVEGVEGVLFAVWAPDAQTVSVVGDFNLWDASRNLMRRLPNSGIFELFVPGLEEGMLYKYEIRTPQGDTFLKQDPYANCNEETLDGASVISDLDSFKFKDGKWLRQRAQAKTQFLKKPMNCYQVQLSLFSQEDNWTYQSISAPLCDYVKKMGYTHVEFMPVMDSVKESSHGYETRGFFAVNSKYGTPKDFMYLVDYLHQNEIGVILDWNISEFSAESSGLCYYDGKALYEDSNVLRAKCPNKDTLCFNYGRLEVSNFLIANALYWVEQFHIDGLRLASVASMLYLDYGRTEGQWLPNIYGSNENLDGIEVLKHMNSIMQKRNPGVLMIAEDASIYPDVTKDLEDGGLGFSMKWNLGWTSDVLDYVTTSVWEREKKSNDLTFSLLYAYNENYMYGFSHKDVIDCESPMIQKMPGEIQDKFANLRILYGFLMTMPGKKYMLMGQEFGYIKELEERVDYSSVASGSECYKMKEYSKALNQLYLAEPALSAMDYEAEGLEWINTISAKDGILVYARKTDNPDDTLVILCNFSNVSYRNYVIGVPYAGKYKEIFNSDLTSFGGNGDYNPRMKQSKEIEWDARKNSIQITVPATGIVVLKYNVAGKVQPIKKTEEEPKVTKPAAKKTEEKPKEQKPTSKKREEKPKAVPKKTEEKPKVTRPAAKETEEKPKKPNTAAKKTEEKSKATEKKAEEEPKTTVKKTKVKSEAKAVTKQVEEKIKKEIDNKKEKPETDKKKIGK